MVREGICEEAVFAQMLPGTEGVMKIPLEKNILGNWQVEAGTLLAYFRNTGEARVAEQE